MVNHVEQFMKHRHRLRRRSNEIESAADAVQLDLQVIHPPVFTISTQTSLVFKLQLEVKWTCLLGYRTTDRDWPYLYILTHLPLTELSPLHL